MQCPAITRSGPNDRSISTISPRRPAIRASSRPCCPLHRGIRQSAFAQPCLWARCPGRSGDSASRGAQPQSAPARTEIVFTSGATESNNLAIKGAVQSPDRRGDHIVTVATEHKAVLDTCRRLEREGHAVTCLPVLPNGLIDLDRLDAAITPRTALVSVMAANNEIGVIQPLMKIGAICRRRGVLFHTDAAQAVGKTDARRGGDDRSTF